jgi:hypothetical protein
MKYDWIRCIGRTITDRVKLKCSERSLSEFKFVRHASHTDFPCAQGNKSSGDWFRYLGRCSREWVIRRSLVIIREVISINHKRDRKYCLLVEECNPFRDANLKNFSILFHKFGGPLTRPGVFGDLHYAAV